MTHQESIILLTPIFKERIWGGRSLQQFGYILPEGNIGECWGISGHPQGQSIIASGRFQGQKLQQVYQNNPHLFNHPKSKELPLLVKIIDAKADLSVQVHPDNTYARQHEIQNGKHESWLVLDTNPHTRLQLGHRAPNSQAFKQMVEEEKWNDLLIYRPIQKDDVIDIQPGTLHALCAGTLVLEIQQSSDVTYRVYDYQRRDAKGELRPLHLPQAIAVTTSPFIEPTITKLQRTIKNQIQTLINNSFYTIEALGVDTPMNVPHPRHRYATVIEGTLTIEGVTLHKGQHAMITSEINQLSISGNGWIIFATSKED